MNQFEETYIGDGVYARWDGCSMLLRTQRDDGWHYIYLEPEHVRTISRLIESEPVTLARGSE